MFHYSNLATFYSVTQIRAFNWQQYSFRLIYVWFIILFQLKSAIHLKWVYILDFNWRCFYIFIFISHVPVVYIFKFVLKLALADKLCPIIKMFMVREHIISKPFYFHKILQVYRSACILGRPVSRDPHIFLCWHS